MKSIVGNVLGVLVDVAFDKAAGLEAARREIARLKDAVVARDMAAYVGNPKEGLRRCAYCGAVENHCIPLCPRKRYPRSLS